MSQIHKHPIPANIAERCLINPDQYKAQYQQSITDPDTFWGEQGKILDWMRPYTRVKNTSFAPGNISIKWYEDGTLNLAANCLDRHLAERGDQTAIIWEGDDASQSKHITYRELHADVCRFANVVPGQRSAAAVERQGQQNHQHSRGGSRRRPGRSRTSVRPAAAEYADHSRRQTEDQTASGRAAKSHRRARPPRFADARAAEN